MKIKAALLCDYLDERPLSNEAFAKRLHVPVSEVEKMLKGEEVEYETARQFIQYFTAAVAQFFIDWKAMNAQNPFAEINKTKEDAE